MAVLLNPNYRFCLVCYKTIDPSTELTKGLKVTAKFINILNHYVKNSQTNNSIIPIELMIKLNGVVNLINCCEGFQDNIEKFCEMYEQLKILEMKLEWKLDELVEEISYADILPTRIIQVNKVLNEVCQNDMERKCSNNTIKTLRQCVVNAGNQKRKQSGPRVLLKRNAKLDEQVRKLTNSTELSGTVSSDSDFKIECEDNADAILPDTLETNSNHIHIEMKTDPFDDDEDDDNWPFEENLPTSPSPSINGAEECQSVENGKIRFKCGKCEKSFGRRFTFKIHLESHKPPDEWKWKCEKCSKKFSAKRHLKDHMEIHNNLRLQCPYCPSQFGVKRYFKCHLRKFHLIDVPKRKTTTVQLNVSHNSLAKVNIEHANISNQNIVSTLPNSSTGQNEDSNREAEKFQCPKCGKEFTRRFSLTTHLEIHKNPEEWKWTCKKCGKKFAASYSLQYHMKSMHVPTSKRRRLQCQFCSVQFSVQKHLNAHIMNNHKDEDSKKKSDKLKMFLNQRSFTCEYTNSRYRFRRNLPENLRTNDSNGETLPQHDIQMKNSNKLEINRLGDDARDVFQVEEESSPNGEYVGVECQEIQVISESQVGNLIERVVVNQGINVIVTENANIFENDESFVNLEDIY